MVMKVAAAAASSSSTTSSSSSPSSTTTTATLSLVRHRGKQRGPTRVTKPLGWGVIRQGRGSTDAAAKLSGSAEA